MSKEKLTERNNAFRGKLLTLRGRVSGLTQSTLAEKLGVSDNTIRSWESGISKIKQDNLKKLIEAYFVFNAFEEGEKEVKELWELADTGAAFDEPWFRKMLLEKQKSSSLGDINESNITDGLLSDSLSSDSINESSEHPKSTQHQTFYHNISRRTLLLWIIGSFIGGSTVGGIVGSGITRAVLQHEAKWQLTESMLQDRRDFRATMLNNGKVLIEGGYASNGLTTAESELFDPIAGVWTKTGGMLNEDRSQHTATLLPNGKVLVAGGFSIVTRKSAELYDPKTDTWRLTKQPMSIDRTRHTATRLNDGRVLIVGGVHHATAELYNPDTDTWSSAGIMATRRSDHIAVRMYDGRVLVAGGTFNNDGKSITSKAEVYDPKANTWTSTSDMNFERAYFTGVLLPDGKVLVIGGRLPDFSSTPTAEIYDPIMGNWSKTDTMRYSRQNPLGQDALLLENGLVLVVGGDAIGTSEVYSPTVESWVSSFKLSTPHSGSSATTLLSKGQVLVAGGMDRSNNIISTCEIYLP